MMIKSVITILLTFGSLVALAQDKLNNNSKTDSVIKSIPATIVGHKQYAYAINGKMQTSEAVKARLYAYAPSKMELRKSSGETSLFGLSVIGFGISGAGAALEYIDDSGPHHNLNGAYILTGVATAFIISSIFHDLSARHHFYKALAVYNQQYQ